MLEIYEITSCSLRRLEEVVASFRELKRKLPSNFEIDNETKIDIQGNFPITWFTCLGGTSGHYFHGMFVAFEKINLRARPPLGFLYFANYGNLTDLEDAILDGDAIRHPNGGVTMNNIRNMDGYDAYTGKKDVIEIQYISTFLRYKGVGKTLVDALKSRSDAELIEVHFDENRKDLASFFEKQGFVNPNIKNHKTNEIYMVANIRKD